MLTDTRQARGVRRGPMLILAALMVQGAAVIHLTAVPMHWEEYVPFGLFFVAAAVSQTAFAAAAVAAPSRRLLLLGAAGNLAIVWLYVVSRTIGVPVGPRPWAPEAVGLPDVVCTGLEVIASILLTVRALRPPRRRHPVTIAVATVPVAILVAALTTAGSGAAIEHMPYAFNPGPPTAGRPSTTVDLLTSPPGDQPVRSFTLTARVARIDGQAAWTYDGTVPGPELRVTQGDRLRVTLVNHLPVSTTIHWHGVPDLPNAEDGVAGITQQAVAPGHSMVYEFVAAEPGTYWYHSHQDTGTQLSRGLFGALVVEPRSGAPEARDYAVVLHSPLAGAGVAINGSAGDLRLPADPGDTVRLRLVNAVVPGMDGTPEAPVLLGTPYRVVALDGRDLHGPQELGPERLPMGMGQRVDLVFTMPAGHAVRLVDTEEHGATTAVSQAFAAGQHPRFGTVTIGAGTAPSERDPAGLPVFDLTAYGMPAPDPVAAGPFDLSAPVVLSEHPGFHDGTIQLVHTINGQAAPAVPAITVREGQLVHLHIVNETGEYHPMHLHGHTMSVLARAGRPLQGSPVHLDTVLVGPHETWDVAFLADNPGIWMLHCHVLLHASMGMMMTIDYAGVTTPYTMGSGSGNVPE